jgi:polyisoprenoid-binding protein YceI
MRKYLVLSSLLLAAGPAGADTYTIDPRHTFPSFEISHIGFSSQRGRFNRTEGTSVLDAKAQTGSVDIRIAADSIDTGLEELETKLKSAEFFDVAKYPDIVFKADKLELAGEKLIAADGTLTLLGVSKPLRLTVEHFQCGMHPVYQRHVCGADASGVIKRSEFGMNAFLPAVGDEVKLRIQVEAFRD